MPIPIMMLDHSNMKGIGPRFCASAPTMPRSIIIRKVTANSPLIAPEAPTTGTGDPELSRKYTKFPAIPQARKKIVVRFAPNSRSKNTPMAINITILKVRCIQPLCRIRVVKGDMRALQCHSTPPLYMAGTNPK